MAETLLEEVHTIVNAPITSLAFLDSQTILAGEGSYLKVFEKASSKLRASKKIFQHHRIHSLKELSASDTSKNSLYVVLGGKSIRLVDISKCREDEAIISFVTEEKQFAAWIWDVISLDIYNEHGRSSHLALISSQNNVFIFNWKERLILNVCSCIEQCILYSGCFWGQAKDEIIVAVGTVFNEVLLWKPFENTSPLSKEAFETKSVWKRLIGHEGVIFSVVFKKDGKELISVSDDRSIRLWNVDDSSCMRVLYGHKARVWSAAYFEEKIVSIGEDATCILWQKDGTILKKMKGHSGKSIWSLAVDESSQSIVTGGGDSGIRAWSASRIVDNQARIAVDVPLPFEVANSPDSLDFKNDFPRTVRLLNTTEALVLTNNGNFLHYNVNESEGQQGVWESVFCDKKYSSYCCVDVDRDDRIAAAGSLCGTIKIIDIDSKVSVEVKAFDGKVFSIFILQKENFIASRVSKPMRYVAGCGPEGQLLIWNFCVNEKCIEIDLIAVRRLPYCRQRWAAAVSLFPSSTYSDSLNETQTISCVVGDRRGSLHVFHGLGDKKQKDQPEEPDQSILSVHGKTGVTSIAIVDNYVYTTGRDGYYRKFRLSEVGEIQPLDRKKACKGMDWMEAIIVNSNDVLVYGFYMQSYFAVWSSNRNEIIVKIQCGGGYRSWDFIMPALEDKPSAFVFLKGPEIKYCSMPCIKSHCIIKEHFHGREVTCVKILGKIKDQPKILLATGSEDTLVMLSTYDFISKELCRIHTLQGHIGSVKSISLSDTDKQSSPAGVMQHCNPYLLFTCGSRTSLKCMRIQFEEDNTINSSLLAEIGTPINSLKGRIKRSDWSNANDVRYLSMEVIPVSFEGNGLSTDISYHHYCVAAACSDGFIRIYGFSSILKKFVLMSSTNFHARCVQTVRHFTVTVDSAVRHLLLSGGTDGRIALWDLTKVLHEFSKFKPEDFSRTGVLSRNASGNSNHHATDCDPEESNSMHGDLDGFSDMDSDSDNEDDCSNGKSKRTATSCSNYFLSSDLHSLVACSSIELMPLHVFHAHQSGIHSIDVIECQSDSSFTIASGGDDNSIFTSNIVIQSFPGPLSVDVIFEDKNIFSHHSTITGVRFISEKFLVSCSVDQRLKIWKYSSSTPEALDSGCRWQVAYECYTDIADVSDLSIWIESSKIHAAVSGVGLEIKEIRTDFVL